MAVTTQGRSQTSARQTSARQASAGQTSMVPDKGLCTNCLWDCVQPLGTTIVCPAWQPRPDGQERQVRQGQQRFSFEVGEGRGPEK